jgi:hypothetical protein
MDPRDIYKRGSVLIGRLNWQPRQKRRQCGEQRHSCSSQCPPILRLREPLLCGERGAVKARCGTIVKGFFRSSLVVTTDTALVPFGCGFPFSFTASAVGEGGAPHGVSHIAARSPATSWSEAHLSRGRGLVSARLMVRQLGPRVVAFGCGAFSMSSTISIYFHAPCRPFAIIIFGRSACWVGYCYFFPLVSLSLFFFIFGPKSAL